MKAMTPSCHVPRLSWRGLAAVLALHAIVLWCLAQTQTVNLPAPLAVLSVSLLPTATPEAPPARAEPPKPRPVERRPPPVSQPQPATPPEASPVNAPAVSVTPQPPTPATPPAPMTAAPAPATPSAPRFDANYLDNPKPVYPPLARRLGEEGRVVLRVQVAPNGLPLAVELHTGSGSARLDQAAIETVRRWKFVPARLGNEAVAAAVLVPIVFSLKD